MGALAVALSHLHGQLAQSFDPFFKHVGSHQHLPVGLPGLSKFMVIAVILSWSSLQDLISVVGCSDSGGSPFLISSGMAAPPFTGGSLPQRTRCPRLSPVPILAHTVEGQAASSAGTPHCTALLFLLGRSCIS